MLSRLFNPKSIAVIGASTRDGAVGNDILKNLINQGYKGKIYPVNPKAEQILDLKCYPSLEQIQENIELAIVVVPAKIVPLIMQSIANKGIKSVIVISAGFKEVGDNGKKLENEITQICKANNISLIGPNCLGVLNCNLKMNASFAADMPSGGKVALISQSGAICTGVIDYASKNNLGFSKIISTGNKAVCSELELLKYLETDLETQVIAMYVEALTDAKSLIQQARQMTKPIIVIKSGKTTAGAHASSSHTGSLASSDVLYNALFEQAGIIRAETMQEFFDFVEVFSKNPIKPTQRTSIVTNAGGPGVLATDTAIQNNLELAKITQTTEKKLREVLPAHANFGNPFDLIGDAGVDRYKVTLDNLLIDEQVDSTVVILTPQTTTQIKETAQVIVDAKNKYNKPIIASFIGQDKVMEGIQLLKQSGVATSSFPENSIKALAKMQWWLNKKQDYTNYKISNEKNLDQINQEKLEHVNKIIETHKQKSQKVITEDVAKKILEAYGLDTVKSYKVTSIEQAKQLSKDLQGKFALKIISPDILHKSDVGGVALDVSHFDLANEYESMIKVVQKNSPNSKIDGVLVTEMVDKTKGWEFILGSKKDPNLGHSIAFGLGGIYVNMFADIGFIYPPFGDKDIDNLINSLKSSALLHGIRHQAPLDVPALKKVIKTLAQILINHPEIAELDMNPILILQEGMGTKTLDVKIILE